MLEEETRSCSRKPSHVRKLEFCRVLPKTNPPSKGPVKETDERVLVNALISEIPSMDKHEFVRRWIARHESYACELTGNESCILNAEIDSDTLESFANQRPSQSPILGKSKKKQHLTNSDDVAYRAYTQFSDHPTHRRPLGPRDVNVEVSPVLRKKRYNNRERQADNHYRFNELHHTSGRNVKSTLSACIKDYGQTTDVCEPRAKIPRKSISDYRDDKIEEMPMTNNKRSIPRSWEDPAYDIVEENSLEYHKEEMNIIDNSSDSGGCSNMRKKKSESILIEDTDSQELVVAAHCGNSALTIIKDDTKDLDSTYCSNAEKLKSRISETFSLQDYPKIFLAETSPTKEVSQNIATGGELSSPSRTEFVRGALLRTMDSAKKRRRRPKKGSLTERLQSLINSETSFTRIWRHRLKRSTDDSSDDPCAEIYVQASSFRFDKQFLSGIVINDSSDLLPKRTSNYTSHLSKNTNYPSRRIVILTSPEIIGNIQLTLGSIVKITPPWNVIDADNLCLAVSYIKVEASERNYLYAMNVLGEERAKPCKARHWEEFCCKCNLSDSDFGEVTPCFARTNDPNVPETLLKDP